MYYKDLTEMENKVLEAIKQDCFYRESDNYSCWCWVDEFAKDAGISIESCKGVLGSLVKKGVVHIDFYDKNFETGHNDNSLQVLKGYRR